jgi:hypothetical protein
MAEALDDMTVEHRVQQYGEIMRRWLRSVGTEVKDCVVAMKASTSFAELTVAANKSRDLQWQQKFRDAIAKAGLPPVHLCCHDTDRDGNCHLCADKGGCVPHGGPFLGGAEPTYASPVPGPKGDPL